MNDFEKLNCINKKDIENKTSNLTASYTLVRGNLNKLGGEIVMGVDAQTFHEIMENKRIVVLYTIDKEKFNEL